MNLIVLYVDDERSAHTIFKNSLGEYENTAQVSYHFNYESAMEYAKIHFIDCAFLDVSMLDKDGITLAKDLRIIQPQIEFVFITAYDEFARNAYEVGGRAYLTKPYSDKELYDALELMHRLTQPRKVNKKQELDKEQSINKKINKNYDMNTNKEISKQQDINKSKSLEKHKHIFIKTFGYFDLFIDGDPMHFKYSKAKELLAFLVHQMGGTVTSAQVFYALWDHQTYTRDNSTYVRRAIRLLKNELTRMGIEDIVISFRNSICVDSQKFTCDAYELLNGSKQAANSFAHEYMLSYPWAKSGIGLLERAVKIAESDK